MALSAVALGLAVFSLTQERPQPVRVSARTKRVTALERRVAELGREIESLKAGRREPIRPDPSASDPEAPGADQGDRDFGIPSGGVRDDKALAAVVDAAVNRKAEQVMDEMRIKADRKPALEVFARMLGLTARQRASVEQVVVDGQRQVHEILDLPTADGTNLKEELIEIVARRFAQPGKDHGWGRLVGRIGSEKIPGTNETYGARIESVKNAMRASFKREWSPAQYREFKEWKVDPTEIQKVRGSPNADLWKRVAERARELGADMPDGGK